MKCYTQNPNESLHHVIWSMSPKDTYNSPTETSLAVALAVCQFNSGFQYTVENMFQLLGMTPTAAIQKRWKSIDDKRIRSADQQNTEKFKLRRKTLKRETVKKQDGFQHYQSGAFDVRRESIKRGRGHGRGRTAAKGRGRGRGRGC